MKLEKMNLYHIRMPLVSPFETSFGRSTDRECILVEGFADGLVGWGECVADRDPGYAYETTGTAWHILNEFMLPLIVGKEIEQPSDVQNVFAAIRGHAMAKAAVEMCFGTCLEKGKICRSNSSWEAKVNPLRLESRLAYNLRQKNWLKLWGSTLRAATGV